MNSYRLILISVLLCCLAGCTEERSRQHSPPETAAGDRTAPVEPTLDPAELSGALINHMHLHASQLKDLNDALSAGDLEAAGTPAYWLSRHKTQTGLPANWEPHIAEMHAAAVAVEEATILATAKAAAQRLEAACRGCHEANNRDIALPSGAVL